jgi:hypothetical protein
MTQKNNSAQNQIVKTSKGHAGTIFKKSQPFEFTSTKFRVSYFWNAPPAFYLVPVGCRRKSPR